MKKCEEGIAFLDLNRSSGKQCEKWNPQPGLRDPQQPGGRH
jgi:hypothetical protein